MSADQAVGFALDPKRILGQREVAKRIRATPIGQALSRGRV
jgi:hypothetical protein